MLGGIAVLDLLETYRQRVIAILLTSTTLVAGTIFWTRTTDKYITPACIFLCVCHAWICVRYLDLWISTSFDMIHHAEIGLFNKSGINAVKLSTVAGLGTTELIDEYTKQSNTEKETQELGEKPVLVMIHGFGGANGYWALSSLRLRERFKVYCMEMPLFGRSTRGSIDAKTPDDWLYSMSDAIEKWVVAMELTEFFLLGHSLGSHAAAAYSVRFPHRVMRLILLSPVAVGTPPRTSRSETRWVSSLLTFCWNSGSIMDFIRFLGPLGKMTVRWGFNLRVKYSSQSYLKEISPAHLKAFADYTYLHWSIKNTGNNSLQTILYPFLPYGRKPLIDWLPPSKHSLLETRTEREDAEDSILINSRINHNSREDAQRTSGCKSLQISIIYGSPTQDWMDSKYGFELAAALKKDGVSVKVYEVPHSGHNVMLDAPEAFAETVIEILEDGY